MPERATYRLPVLDQCPKSSQLQPYRPCHSSGTKISAKAGKIIQLTACQPELCRIDPARNDTAAVAAKTKKSFMPCALLRSAGVWQSVTTAVAPMKLKFQPMPSSASEP